MSDNKTANLSAAVELCRKIEEFAPQYGSHVALTGGCLYKDGDRKDIDLLFYRIRQVDDIDYTGLFNALSGIGFSDCNGFGWLFKSTYAGVNIDMFFPEEEGEEYYEHLGK